MSVALVIAPRERDLGDGMKVRRALPFVHKRMVGPFIFWDHMGPVTIDDHFSMTVRSHPHIGLSTLTYLFSGEILHRDTLGNELPIRAGEVNWMTAGRGIAHSERASSTLGQQGQILEGIQLWIALPLAAEELPPSFTHFAADELPHYLSHGVSWKVIAGDYQGVRSPVAVYSDLFYLDASLRAGQGGELPMTINREAALYVAQGAVKVQGQSYGAGHLVVFKPGHTVSFTCDEFARVLIFGGEPLPEPRFIWWNFVSSRQERIEEAKLAWTEQRMGKVYGERETEWIPLPSK